MRATLVAVVMLLGGAGCFDTLGGAVHDFVILASSVRSGGRSLAEIARDEVGPLAGLIAAVAMLIGRSKYLSSQRRR